MVPKGFPNGVQKGWDPRAPRSLERPRAPRIPLGPDRPPPGLTLDGKSMKKSLLNPVKNCKTNVIVVVIVVLAVVDAVVVVVFVVVVVNCRSRCLS